MRIKTLPALSSLTVALLAGSLSLSTHANAAVTWEDIANDHHMTQASGQPRLEAGRIALGGFAQVCTTESADCSSRFTSATA